jgi:hypothetical protein
MLMGNPRANVSRGYPLPSVKYSQRTEGQRSMATVLHTVHVLFAKLLGVPEKLSAEAP